MEREILHFYLWYQTYSDDDDVAALDGDATVRSVLPVTMCSHT